MPATTTKSRRKSAESTSQQGGLYQPSLYKFVRPAGNSRSSQSSAFKPYPSTSPRKQTRRQKENVAPETLQREAQSSPIRNPRKDAKRISSSDKHVENASIGSTASTKRKTRDWEYDEDPPKEVIDDENAKSPVFKKRRTAFSHSAISNSSPIKKGSALHHDASFDFDTQLAPVPPVISSSPAGSFQPLFDDVIPGSDPFEAVESSQTQYLSPFRPKPSSSPIPGLSFPKPSEAATKKPSLFDILEEDINVMGKDDSVVIPSSQPELQMLGDDFLSPVKPHSPVKLIRRTRQPPVVLTTTSPARVSDASYSDSSPTKKMTTRVQRIRRTRQSLPAIDPTKPAVGRASPIARRSSSESSLEKQVTAALNTVDQHDPFWETQPLLTFDDGSSLSDLSPSPQAIPTNPLPPSPPGNIQAIASRDDDEEAEEFDSSITQDSSPIRPDPDRTLVNTTGPKPMQKLDLAKRLLASSSPLAHKAKPAPSSSPTRTHTHTHSTGRTLVRNSSSEHEDNEEVDKTMINPSSISAGKKNMEKKDDVLTDLIRSVRGLSPLAKKSKRVIMPLHEVIDLEDSSDEERKQSPTDKVKRVRVEEPRKDVTFNEELGIVPRKAEEEMEPEYSPFQIGPESQWSNEESFPIMSLPANWSTLETPRKNRSSSGKPIRALVTIPDLAMPGSDFDSEEEEEDDEYGEDDAFGADLSPRSMTAANGWPEVVLCLENQRMQYLLETDDEE